MKFLITLETTFVLSKLRRLMRGGNEHFAESPKWERHVGKSVFHGEESMKKGTREAHGNGGGVNGSGTCKLKNKFFVLIKN